MPAEPSMIYICRQCFLADTVPGACPNCRQPRVECDPGDPDNPCRRPPMDAQGRILSRAPLWWVVRGAPYLRDQLRRMLSNSEAEVR